MGAIIEKVTARGVMTYAEERKHIVINFGWNIHKSEVEFLRISFHPVTACTELYIIPGDFVFPYAYTYIHSR